MATTQPMTHPIPEDEVHRYADWEVRPRERTLTVRGEAQKIGARAFDVLLALIRHADRTMSRAELLDAAWPGLVVEENNLSVQISTLRRLLGATSIVNIAGLGYRLAAARAEAVAAPKPGIAPLDPAPSTAALLIGRDAEIAALLPRLDAARLLTLVGTGGVGKSSLARALLAATATEWRDGVHWIDLESLPPGTEVLALVGRSLGVVMDDEGMASGDVMRSLSRLQALVVLDNCEHLLDDVTACIAPLLSSAPAIQWLATSQEPLHVQGEEVFRLLPLQVAASGATVDEATSCGALALLRHRAQAADRTFTIDAGNVAAALDPCRAFDGLPLAIEMAAARVATLGLDAVHAQLNLPMALRSGLRQSTPRHHTLLQAYEWSHGLLSPQEQRLFRQLQPFQGGFTTALLERFVAGLPESANWTDGSEPTDLLAALVDKSLVQKMPAGEPGTPSRYRLLESARSFARLQLQAHGEKDTVDAGYADAVASWFDDSEEDWRRWRDAQWAALYVPERENVVAATRWACGRERIEPDLLARLVTAATQLEVFTHGKAGVSTYPVPLARLGEASPAWRARACDGLGWAHYLDGDGELGTRLLERALADFESIGDTVGAYLSLTRLIRLYRGRPGKQSGAAALWSRLQRIDLAAIPLRLRIYAEATVGRHFDANVSVTRLTQLVRLARQAGFDSQAVLAQVNLTDHLLLQQRYADAIEAADIVLSQSPRFLRPYMFVVHNRTLALVRLGRAEEARHDALRLLRSVPTDSHMVMDLFALAAAQAGRLNDAALLAGHSASIKEHRQFVSETAEAAVVGDTMDALRSAIEAGELKRLLAIGASMPTDDILSLAGLV